ncbi:MAG: hypothetical protein HOQ05_07055 [Corynebacteriales bacterium]|nr:hypothetical protein [Mycobacteriales bacterium]
MFTSRAFHSNPALLHRDLTELAEREPAFFSTLDATNITPTREDSGKVQLNITFANSAPLNVRVGLANDRLTLEAADRPTISALVHLKNSGFKRRSPRRLEQRRAIGLAIAWPLARLAQEHRATAVARPEVAAEIVALQCVFPGSSAPKWQRRQWRRDLYSVRAALGFKQGHPGSEAVRAELHKQAPDTQRATTLFSGRIWGPFTPIALHRTHGELTGSALLPLGFITPLSGLGGAVLGTRDQRARYWAGMITALAQNVASRVITHSIVPQANAERGRVAHRILRQTPIADLVKTVGLLGTANGLGRAGAGATSAPPPNLSQHTYDAMLKEIALRHSCVSAGQVYGMANSNPSIVDGAALAVTTERVLRACEPADKQESLAARGRIAHRAIETWEAEHGRADLGGIRNKLNELNSTADDPKSIRLHGFELEPTATMPRVGTTGWRALRKLLLPQLAALGVTATATTVLGDPTLVALAGPSIATNLLVNIRTHVLLSKLRDSETTRIRNNDHAREAHAELARKVLRMKLDGEEEPLPMVQPHADQKDAPNPVPYLMEGTLLAVPVGASGAIVAGIPALQSTFAGMAIGATVTPMLVMCESYYRLWRKNRIERMSGELDADIAVRKLVNGGLPAIVDEIDAVLAEASQVDRLFATYGKTQFELGLLVRGVDGYSLRTDDNTPENLVLRETWRQLWEENSIQLREQFLYYLAVSGMDHNRLIQRLQSFMPDYDGRPEQIVAAINDQKNDCAKTLAQGILRYEAMSEHLPDVLAAWTPFEGLSSVFDIDKPKLARSLCYLPNDDGDTRLAAVAMETAIRCGQPNVLTDGIEIDVPKLLAHLPQAAYAIRRSVIDVREGRSLIPDATGSSISPRNKRATRRYLRQQLAQATDEDAPIDFQDTGMRAKYVRHLVSAIEAQAAATSGVAAPQRPLKIQHKQFGGVLGDDEQLHELLRGHAAKVNFASPEALRVQAAMFGYDPERLITELQSLIADDSMKLSIQYLPDGSARAAFSATEFNWHEPAKTPGCVLSLCDVDDYGGAATKVEAELWIPPTPQVESEPQVRGMRRLLSFSRRTPSVISR